MSDKKNKCCTYVVPAPKKKASHLCEAFFLLVAGKIEISNQFIEDLAAVAIL